MAEQGGLREAPKEVCTCTSVPSYFVVKAARGVPCLRAGAAGPWSPTWPWQDGNVLYPGLAPTTSGLPSPQDLQTRCLLRNQVLRRLGWDTEGRDGDKSQQTPGPGRGCSAWLWSSPAACFNWRDLFFLSGYTNSPEAPLPDKADGCDFGVSFLWANKILPF